MFGYLMGRRMDRVSVVLLSNRVGGQQAVHFLA